MRALERVVSVSDAQQAKRSTREAILEVAAHCFAEQGYHRTSLHEVAREVGIQKASIFHYFSSKEALYRAVLQASTGKTETMFRQALTADGGWMDRARALLDAYVDLVAAHPGQTKILLRQSLGDVPDGYDGRLESERLLAMANGFLLEGQRAGAFAAFDVTSLVLGVAGMVTFYFTSAPLVAPAWCEHLTYEHRVERVRRHVTTVVMRTLAMPVRASTA